MEVNLQWTYATQTHTQRMHAHKSSESPGNCVFILNSLTPSLRWERMVGRWCCLVGSFSGYIYLILAVALIHQGCCKTQNTYVDSTPCREVPAVTCVWLCCHTSLLLLLLCLTLTSTSITLYMHRAARLYGRRSLLDFSLQKSIRTHTLTQRKRTLGCWIVAFSEYMRSRDIV